MNPTPWRKGQLGRFKSESPKNPRFEVLGSDKGRGGVSIWYSFTKDPVVIPFDTFKKDCVNWWQVSVVNTVPSWIKKGAEFQLKRLEATISRYSHRWRVPWELPHEIRESFYEDTLTLRGTHHDFASCFWETQGLLVLLPLQMVIDLGYQRTTSWDRILSDDDPFTNPETEIERYL